MRTKIINRVLVSLIITTATLVAIYAIYFYLILWPGTAFEAQKLIYLQHTISITLHATFGGIALFLGALQLVRRLREKFPKANIVARRIYYISVIISSLSGLYVATFAHGGLVNKLGFTLLALSWIYSVVHTIQADLKGDIEMFRIWIVRNYALTFSAVTLRIYLPILESLYGFDQAYSTVGFLCWVPNLIFIEWFYLRKLK
jgi:hypothetical protein